MANVRIVLPRALAELAGSAEVKVEAATVREALRALDSLAPNLYDRICTEQHEPRKHVLIYVGDEEIRLSGGISRVLADGETIHIVAAVSGG